MIYKCLCLCTPKVIKLDNRIYDSIPNDPQLSCYLLKNGSWSCMEDVVLKFYDVYPDDSY